MAMSMMPAVFFSGTMRHSAGRGRVPAFSDSWPSWCLARSSSYRRRRQRRIQTLATSSFAADQETSRRALLQRAIKEADVEKCIHLLKDATKVGEPCIRSKDLRVLIGLALDRGSPEQAIGLVTSLPTPDPRSYSVLMGECLQRKNSKALRMALTAREASGIPPDAYTTTAELTALGLSKEPQQALVVLRRAWEDPRCRRVEVCNAAINACATSGYWQGAWEAMELLCSTPGMSPDIITYNSLIKAAGASKKMSKVREIYSELKDSHIRTNSSTYCAIFSAAARNRYLDVTWLFQVFDDMSIRANDFVLSSFFSAVSVSRKCTRQELDVVFSALAEARGYGPLNDHTYAALLSLVTRQGIPARTIDVWTAALQDSIPLSPHIFSSLFAACAAGSTPALLDVALDAYADLREWWESQDKRRMAPWMERDARVAYNSLLNFVGHAGRVDEVLVVLQDMRREGPLPDVVTYNTAISVFGRSGDVETANAMFQEMLDAGVSPTEKTFGALLNAFAKAGDASSARRVFESMDAMGVKLNVVLFTSYIDALVRHGEPLSLSMAFQVADQMRQVGLTPSEVTYGCLLIACEKTGDVPRAFALYRQACAEGIPPSDEMHNILINVCTRSGKLDEALDLVKSTARAHAKLQQHTLDSLVRALSTTSPGRALRMLSLMQTMDMSPSTATYLALVTACAKSSDVMEALALYRSMKAQGMEVDGAAGSALIICLCRMGDLTQAVHIYIDMMAAAWRPHSRRALEVGEGIGSKRSKREGSLSRSSLPKRAQVPSAAALASLVQAFSESGRLSEAWRFYKQLRRSKHGFQDATVTHRRMFEVLMEEYCRRKNIDRALVVFDDWKAASSSWYARQVASSARTSNPPSEGGKGTVKSSADASGVPDRHPRLSNVTLAFLEACCRVGDPSLMWRVYDVCAVMRGQKERKLQESLARPQKASHHVMGSVAKPSEE